MRQLTIALALALNGACATPGALRFVQLTPMLDSTVTTAADLYEQGTPELKARAPVNAHQIVILYGDSVIAALSVYELNDIFWLDGYVYNDKSTPFVISPTDVVLLDGNRTALRQLRPEQAANIYMAEVTGIPPYQPKYIYDVTASTQGYVSAVGNTAYYQSQTQGTVTTHEDPYHALGYSIGAAIAADRNKKFSNMAGAVYSSGFVENSTVPSKAGGRGGMYWLKPAQWQSPLIVRFVQSGYEVRFVSTRSQ